MPAQHSATIPPPDLSAHAGTSYGTYLVSRGSGSTMADTDDRVGMVVDVLAQGDADPRLWLGTLIRITPDDEVRDRVIIATARHTAPDWLSKMTELRLIAASPFTNMITNLVNGLGGAAAVIDSDDVPAVIDAVLLMARNAWERPAEPDAPSWTGGDADMIAAARLVEERLLDRNLDAESLMLALGLSRSSLYRTFRAFGGVNAYIRQRRLENAHEVLGRRTGPRPTVGEVAHSHGFASDSHFSRAFRKAFGYPPGSRRDAGNDEGPE